MSNCTKSLFRPKQNTTQNWLRAEVVENFSWRRSGGGGSLLSEVDPRPVEIAPIKILSTPTKASEVGVPFLVLNWYRM